MEIRSARELDELKEVLQNTQSEGPPIAYWVFSDITEEKWENMTVTTPGKYGEEYPKTYGHYHTASDADEIYRLVSGKGVFMLQRKHYNEKGTFIPNIVEEVLLIKAEKPGEEIVVPKEYGHSWSNIGEEPLVTFDNWRFKHKPTDYEPIKNQQGLAFYLIEKNGEVQAVPNPKYKEHPKPIWLTPKEFAERNNITSLV